MEQEMALVVYQSPSLVDDGASRLDVAVDDDASLKKMGEEQELAFGHEPKEVDQYGGEAEYVPLRGTNMGQEMALVVHQSISLIDNSGGRCTDGEDDDDDDLKLVDEDELAIVVAHEFNYVPLIVVPPESEETAEEQRPESRYEQRPKIYIVYERKRGKLAGSKPTKIKIDQKPALFHSSSGSSNYGKGDNMDEFESPVPKNKKRGRPTGSKLAKKKCVTQKISDDSDDDGRKKYARVIKGSACDRALKVKKKLPAEGPSFVRDMLHSHVEKGFWLGLPASFCREHLPDDDATIALEDEEGHTKYTEYKAHKTGLSAGWRGFAKQHGLKVGDVLVFQLVTPTRFNVYIVRENKSKEESEVTRVYREPCDYDDDSNNLASEDAPDGGVRFQNQDSKVHAVKSLMENFKRRRGKLAGSNPAKGKIDHKLALFDSSRGSIKYSNDDNNDEFEPPVPTKKRGRTAGSKFVKKKRATRQICDDGWKKYARVVKGSAWDRALKVENNLPAEGPSFVRDMLPSHVEKGFLLALPASFCVDHLPDDDATIALEDEEGHTKYTQYKAHRMTLSSGWHGFAIQHDLKVGDVLVFQLVTPTRFKVYIVRENMSEEDSEVIRVYTKPCDPEDDYDYYDYDNIDCEDAADGGMRIQNQDREVDAVKSLKRVDDLSGLLTLQITC